MGADVGFVPGPGGFLGELVAWDAGKGQRAWSVPEALPLYAGALATAGNVVFYGTLDGHFKAVDASTGAPLFDKQLECGIVGNPISYTAPDGKQRVAVYTGVGWLAGGFAGGPCPAGGGFGGDAGPLANADGKMVAGRTVPKLAGATSSMLHVFKLP